MERVSTGTLSVLSVRILARLGMVSTTPRPEEIDDPLPLAETLLHSDLVGLSIDGMHRHMVTNRWLLMSTAWFTLERDCISIFFERMNRQNTKDRFNRLKNTKKSFSARLWRRSSWINYSTIDNPHRATQSSPMRTEAGHVLRERLK